MDVKERCSSGYLFYRDRGVSAVANLPQDPSNEGFPSGTATTGSGNSMGSYTRLDGQTLVENGQLTPPGSKNSDRSGILAIDSQAILLGSRVTIGIDPCEKTPITPLPPFFILDPLGSIPIVLKKVGSTTEPPL